jgi:hypothetical protein
MSHTRAVSFLTLLAICTMLAPAVASTATLPFTVADFEGDDAVEQWSIETAPADSAGSLELGQGHSGRGAALSYELTAAGAWVTAWTELEASVTAPVIELWLHHPVDVYVTVLVADSTDQVVQYLLLRPFTNLDVASWYRGALVLQGPIAYSGGADDGAVHGGVSAVGVAVHSVVPGTTAGTLMLDDIALAALPEHRVRPAAPAVLPLNTACEALGDRLGINIHFRDEGTLAYPELLSTIRDVGFHWVRTDLSWDQVERVAGSYEFDPWDAWLNALTEHDLSSLLILDYGHPLHTNGLPPTTADEIEAFGDFAAASAEHFSAQPVAFEIWNEPNTVAFWPPDADPAEHAALLQHAAERIHEAAPSAPVVSGGITSHDYAYLDRLLASGIGEANAIGVHPYLEIPEMLAMYLPWTRSIRDTALSEPERVPFWQTEWGYSSAGVEADGHSAAGRRMQAVLLSREVLLTWAADFPLMVLYELIDGGPDPLDREQNFGLLTISGEPKAALEAVRTVTTQYAHLVPAGFQRTPLSNLHAIALDGPQQRTVAVWYAGLDGEVPIILPTHATVSDFLGCPVEQPTEPADPILLGADDGPIFVTVQRRGPPRTIRGLGR